jgi:hypothetical protein
MSLYVRSLAVLALLFAQSSFAGIISIPVSTGVPVDSPWVISGLILALAVIGARLLQNRRK